MHSLTLALCNLLNIRDLELHSAATPTFQTLTVAAAPGARNLHCKMGFRNFIPKKIAKILPPLNRNGQKPASEELCPSPPFPHTPNDTLCPGGYFQPDHSLVPNEDRKLESSEATDIGYLETGTNLQQATEVAKLAINVSIH